MHAAMRQEDLVNWYLEEREKVGAITNEDDLRYTDRAWSMGMFCLSYFAHISTEYSCSLVLSMNDLQNGIAQSSIGYPQAG